LPKLFLMHRVELKWREIKSSPQTCLPVPNAPCGVEIFVVRGYGKYIITFLMHRVELKLLYHTPAANRGVPNAPCGVERNDVLQGQLKPSTVPNAPCGVESPKK